MITVLATKDPDTARIEQDRIERSFLEAAQPLDFALLACDEVTGLIIAAALCAGRRRRFPGDHRTGALKSKSS